jgi:hypothetical protein
LALTPGNTGSGIYIDGGGDLRTLEIVNNVIVLVNPAYYIQQVNFGTTAYVYGNTGYIAPGEVRSITKAITAGVQNTVTSLQNTFGGDVLITEAYMTIATAAPSDAPTYDMGTDDDGAGAPSVANNLFDAIPDTVAYYASRTAASGGTQTVPVIWQAAGNDWVNFIITDDDGAGMVGTIYITVIGK